MAFVRQVRKQRKGNNSIDSQTQLFDNIKNQGKANELN
jgi:hypothetical protein